MKIFGLALFTESQETSGTHYMSTSTHHITWQKFSLELGGRTHIMGIVNVTPDSFSDGGSFYACDAAVKQAEKLVKDGADIVDIGGESTRPFSDPLSAEEEIRRVIPVIEKIAGRISVPVSIDTTKAIVAEKAIIAGASIVNDISALRSDPNMAAVVSKYQVPVVLMHMKGCPKTMQADPVYRDLVGEIKSFLTQAIRHAKRNGISQSKIIADPGIGFGKTFAHNLALLNCLHEFKDLQVPLLIGPSRKAFIRNLLKDPTEKDIHPQKPCVETGTQAAIAAGVLHGAHIVRVHDVANTLSTLKIIDAIKNSRPD